MPAPSGNKPVAGGRSARVSELGIVLPATVPPDMAKHLLLGDPPPADEAVHHTCFSCHEPVKARDFVFTRYAP